MRFEPLLAALKPELNKPNKTPGDYPHHLRSQTIQIVALSFANCINNVLTNAERGSFIFASILCHLIWKTQHQEGVRWSPILN